MAEKDGEKKRGEKETKLTQFIGENEFNYQKRAIQIQNFALFCIHSWEPDNDSSDHAKQEDMKNEIWKAIKRNILCFSMI